MTSQSHACAAAVIVALGTLGCPSAKNPRTFDGPSLPRESKRADRKEVDVTVYNDGFGVVREVRAVDVPPGVVELSFRDVARLVEPTTVHLKSLTSPDALAILEQDYRYDLLDGPTLLRKYVGRNVKLHRYDRERGEEQVVDAEVLAVDRGVVLRTPDGITFGDPRRITFPDLPADLVAEPTLVWLLGSTKPKQDLEVTYRTRGLQWHADYVMKVDADAKRAHLTGWITLANDSGATFENARLKLVAGNVQTVTDIQTAKPMTKTAVVVDESKHAGFTEEAFFEYHLYTLDRLTDLLDHEQKQVQLLEAFDVPVKKHLVVNGNDAWYRNDYGAIPSKQRVDVIMKLRNDEASHMGMPLPKGVVRVYQADSSGADQFVGEDAIDHTPRDEDVSVRVGESFDVVVDRRRTDWKVLDDCRTESAWEVDVRNHGARDAVVELMEPAGGTWTILQSSIAVQKKSQTKFELDAPVPAKGETKVTYRVRVSWC